MADTTVHADLQVQQWRNRFFKEYVRNNRFRRYMGTSTNSIIHIAEDLTKKKGDRITIPLVGRLKGTGVSGNARLSGNEEKLDNFGHKITVDVRRHGVIVTEWEEQKSAIDLFNAARPQLMTWEMEQLRDDIITGLHQINGVDYASATETQKDNWLADNSDRVLFGALKSNNSSNDHSASLANVDSTDDKLDADMVSLARRMAQDADPHIRPFRVMDGDEEWFVMFSPTRSFRDLKADSTIRDAEREARERSKNNPLFRPGDILWDGVIVREVPEIGYLTGVGASSIDVAPNFLCGAQSVGVAWAQRPTPRRKTEDDYGFEKGIGIQEMIGVEKLQFNDTAANGKYDHGIVTVYTSGVADS